MDVLEERGWRTIGEGICLPAGPVGDEYGKVDYHGFEKQFRYRRMVNWSDSVAEKRVFLKCDGFLHSSTVLVDGVVCGTTIGGYTPTRLELTHKIPVGRSSELAIEVDSRRRADIAPFGRRGDEDCPTIDFYSFGGISRVPTLEILPVDHVWSVRVMPSRDVSGAWQVQVVCDVDWCPDDWRLGGRSRCLELTARLTQEGRSLGSARCDVMKGLKTAVLEIQVPESPGLWRPEDPRLCEIEVTVRAERGVSEELKVECGIRTVDTSADGLVVNGEHYKIRGLSRHELFPYIGACAPRELHYLDAVILKKELGLNLVRTSHYPQSPEFLRACDQVGLMVFEEVPGWGYLGDSRWRRNVAGAVAAMIRRDFNHPSIVMWGIRCNEAPHDGELYLEMNKIAHDLDPLRPTGGARVEGDYRAPIVEDIACFNDYSEVPRPANHGRYLVSEFVGAITPRLDGEGASGGHIYHRAGNYYELEEQGLRHARFYNGLMKNQPGGGYMGGIGWVAFDYPSPCGLKRRWRDIKTPGIYDMFRIPKLAAGFYASQREASDEPVVMPNFVWDERLFGTLEDDASGWRSVWVWSNCDEVVAEVDGSVVATGRPCRDEFSYLRHPPVKLKIPVPGPGSEVLIVRGLVENMIVLERSFDARRRTDRVFVKCRDGFRDSGKQRMIEVVAGVCDAFGNYRYQYPGILTVEVVGGTLVGQNSFDLEDTGAVVAVYVETLKTSHADRLRVKAEVAGLGIAEEVVSVTS